MGPALLSIGHRFHRRHDIRHLGQAEIFHAGRKGNRHIFGGNALDRRIQIVLSNGVAIVYMFLAGVRDVLIGNLTALLAVLPFVVVFHLLLIKYIDSLQAVMYVWIYL